jgi:hypothetical protein
VAKGKGRQILTSKLMKDEIHCSFSFQQKLMYLRKRQMSVIALKPKSAENRLASNTRSKVNVTSSPT